MAGSSVIKEFLVALGYKIDDQGFKRFTDSISRSTREAAELGATVTTTATAIGIAVEKIARQYEDLYYASQRTGATVMGLRATQFGFKQIGSDAATARSSVEAFAASIRTNPGIAGLVRSMGIDPTNAQEAALKVVEKLKTIYGEAKYYAAAATMTQLFGMDEQTFRQVWTNLDTLKVSMVEHTQKAREAGVESDADTASFLKFARAVNSLEDSFLVLEERITKDFLGPAQATVEAIDAIIQAVGRLDKASGGKVGFWGGLGTTAVGALIAKKLAWKLFGLGNAGAPIVTEGAGAAAGGFGLGSIASKLLGSAGFYFGSTGPAGESDVEERRRRENSPDYRAWLDKKNGTAVSGAVSAGRAAVGGEELVTVTTSNGVKMTVAKSAAPSLLGFINAIEAAGAPVKGIGGYNARKIAGTDVWSEHAKGRALDIDQSGRNVVSMEFARWAREHPQELREALARYGIKSGADFSNPDFGHFEWTGAAVSPGASSGASVTLQHKTDIKISGVSDPKAAADATGDALTRVYGDQVRIAGGAVR